MYDAQPYRLSSGQVARLLALSELIDLKPGPGGSRITPLGQYADECHSVTGLSGLARIIALYPSAQLVAHADAPMPGIRIHIPLQVNSGCWVFHAGTWQQLLEGFVYHMDPTQPHGAVNWGAQLRMHLMIDQEAR